MGYRFCSHTLNLCDYLAAHLGGTHQNLIDAARKQLGNAVIKPSQELSACCDVANGAKHLVLHRKSYVTGTTQGHAKVVSHNIDIGVPTIKIAVLTEATATVIHPDGSTDADDPVAPRPISVPAPDTEAEGADDGYAVDTFDIEINGQRHDARDVGAKAVAAWDTWLKAQGML